MASIKATPACTRWLAWSFRWFGLALILLVALFALPACTSLGPKPMSAAEPSQVPPVGADYGFSILNYTPYEMNFTGTSGPGKFSLPPSTMAPLSLSNFRMIFYYAQDNKSVITYDLKLSEKQQLLQITAVPGWGAFPPTLSCAWVGRNGQPINPPLGVECGITADNSRVYLIQNQLVPTQIQNLAGWPMKYAKGSPNISTPPPATIDPAKNGQALSAKGSSISFEYEIADLWSRHYYAKFEADYSGDSPKTSCSIYVQSKSSDYRYPLSGPMYPTCVPGTEFSPLTFSIKPPSVPMASVEVFNLTGIPLVPVQNYVYTLRRPPSRLTYSTVLEAVVGLPFIIGFGNAVDIFSADFPNELKCETRAEFRCEVTQGAQPSVRIYLAGSAARPRKNPSAARIRSAAKPN